MINSPDKNDNLYDSACDVGESIQDAAYHAGQKVRGYIHDAGDEISHAKKYVGSEIRNNPLRSGIIAIGVGVIIGILIRR